jgi:hypothetical protein
MDGTGAEVDSMCHSLLSILESSKIRVFEIQATEGDYPLQDFGSEFWEILSARRSDGDPTFQNLKVSLLVYMAKHHVTHRLETCSLPDMARLLINWLASNSEAQG